MTDFMHHSKRRFSLRANDVSCIRQDARLFQPISFQLQAGQGLWIEGPNGVGKSSLLRMLAGFAACRHGQIVWQDETAQTANSFTEQLHYVGHADGIRAGLTVLENLQLASELSLQKMHDMQAVLAAMQLTASQHKQVKYLSAGQKRRVALCKVFSIPRAIWILDEPLTALDQHTQQMVLSAIAKHLDQGGICVMTSHQPLPTTLPQLHRLELSSC